MLAPLAIDECTFTSPETRFSGLYFFLQTVYAYLQSAWRGELQKLTKSSNIGKNILRRFQVTQHRQISNHSNGIMWFVVTGYNLGRISRVFRGPFWSRNRLCETYTHVSLNALAIEAILGIMLMNLISLIVLHPLVKTPSSYVRSFWQYRRTVTYGPTNKQIAHLGATAQEVRPPMGSRGTVYIHCLQILIAQKIKVWKLCTIHLLILDQYFSRWGLSDIFGA